MISGEALRHPEPFSWTERLSLLPGVDFCWSEPLARHTTFRVGGPVRCLARPESMGAFAGLVQAVREEGIPFFILGGGSNVLAPDGELEAVAIQPHRAFAAMEIRRAEGEGIVLFAEAGVRLAALLGFCLRHGLGGFECLVGIPGTVGGALVMNAGTPEGCIGEALLWIDVIDAGGKLRRVDRSELAIGYRSMGLSGEWVLTGAGFGLRSMSARDSRARMLDSLKRRKRTQPLEWPSAGCVYKNPPGHSTGALVEKCGLKGLRIGDAQVSEKHANWIVNRGCAKAREILALMEHIEDRVFERFGVHLEREIRILGHEKEI